MNTVRSDGNYVMNQPSHDSKQENIMNSFEDLQRRNLLLSSNSEISIAREEDKQEATEYYDYYDDDDDRSSHQLNTLDTNTSRKDRRTLGQMAEQIQTKAKFDNANGIGVNDDDMMGGDEDDDEDAGNNYASAIFKYVL